MKFRASWGQVVVINTIDQQTRTPVRYYMRAEVPPWCVEDVRAMALEEKHPEVQDPVALYNLVKRVVPQKDEFIVTLPGQKEEDRYFTSRAVLDSLPFFSWEQVFNLAGTEMPDELKPKKGRSKK